MDHEGAEGGAGEGGSNSAVKNGPNMRNIDPQTQNISEYKTL